MSKSLKCQWVGNDKYFSVAAKPKKRKGNPDLNARKRKRAWARKQALHNAAREARLLDE